MMKFQLGDRVVMSTVGRGIFPDKPSNPHNLHGIIVHLSPICVKWSNGQRNGYYEHHLNLIDVIKENE